MEMNKLLSNPYNSLPVKPFSASLGNPLGNPLGPPVVSTPGILQERVEFEARNFLSKLSNNVANAAPEKKESDEVII